LNLTHLKMSELNSNIEEDKKNEDRINDIIINNEEEEEECIGCDTGADHPDAHTAACNLANGFSIH